MPDGDVLKELREALAVVLAGGADDPEAVKKKATELMARAKQASGVGFTAAVETADDRAKKAKVSLAPGPTA